MAKDLFGHPPPASAGAPESKRAATPPARPAHVGMMESNAPPPAALRPAAAGGLVHLGCSGYHYQDWVGHFYPEGTRPSQYLAHYFRSFHALEVNQTFYRPPTLKSMSDLSRKAPATARIAVKLPGLFTHQRSGTTSDAEAFREAIKPLQQSGQLGCVLAQFPFQFKPSQETGDDIRRIVDWFGSLKLAVEIRNAAWQREGFYTYLKQAGVALCSVDAPELAGLPVRGTPATADFAYVRLHGRNAEKWWNHERPEQRYTYLYSNAELSEWRTRLVEMATQTTEVYVFFNNHFEGRAPSNALTLRGLLDESAHSR